MCGALPECFQDLVRCGGTEIGGNERGLEIVQSRFRLESVNVHFGHIKTGKFGHGVRIVVVDFANQDADAAHGHAEHLGQLHAHGVWVLRRGPHGQGALLVPSRERRVRLHGIVLHARESVDILHDDVRPREGMRALPALEMELVADVGAGPGLEGGEIGEVAGQRLGRVDEGGAGSERLLQSGHGRQLLVRDLDQLEGLGGGALALGDHGGHGLALVARDLDGEDGAVAEGRTVVRIAPVQIGAGDDGTHAGRGPGAGDVHAEDLRVGVRRAEQLRVERAGQLHVRDIARAPRHLLGRVDAPHRLPDHAQRLGVRSHIPTIADGFPLCRHDRLSADVGM